MFNKKESGYENLVTIIKELAEEDDRTFSQYINLVLKEWVKNKRERNMG